MTRTVMITGAGSGIGRATARAFMAQGWRVAMMGRRAEALEETAQGNPMALVLPGDVSLPADVERAFAGIEREWGRLDLLFNNAGLSLKAAPIDEIAVEDWQRLAEVNITGMFLGARAAFGLMRRQQPQGGRIINNGSISAHAPRPGSAPYTISKHAITGLTKTLALDGRPFDIACGQIDIGNAETEMTRKFAEGEGARQADGSMRREAIMDARHVADAVVYMAGLPLSANVLSMSVMATGMPYVGRG